MERRAAETETSSSTPRTTTRPRRRREDAAETISQHRYTRLPFSLPAVSFLLTYFPPLHPPLCCSCTLLLHLPCRCHAPSSPPLMHPFECGAWLRVRSAFLKFHSLYSPAHATHTLSLPSHRIALGASSPLPCPPRRIPLLRTVYAFFFSPQTTPNIR